jgi:hypothetical protein
VPHSSYSHSSFGPGCCANGWRQLPLSRARSFLGARPCTSLSLAPVVPASPRSSRLELERVVRYESIGMSYTVFHAPNNGCNVVQRLARCCRV